MFSKRMLSTGLAGLFAFGITAHCRAQLVFPKPSSQPESFPAKSRAAEKTKQTGRFLGWKFAATGRQDTSRWIKGASSTEHRAGMVGASPHASAHVSTTSSITGNVGFSSAPTLPTGFLPTAVVNGDFNEDGKADLAVSNGGDNSVYVYLGNGDGTFAIPLVLYTAGQSPVWLVATKLRTNGHLDLVTVDGDSNQLEVFSGNGDGTFQSSTVVATLPQAPSFLLSDDFNKDGHADLVIGLVIAPESTGAQFGLLAGIGDGNFSAPILSPAIENSDDSPIVSNWLAAGDLNGDGFLDLVVTTSFAQATSYLNQNGTAFVGASGFGPNDSAVTVALADVNNDGCLDAVEAGAAGFLTIATGNCNGSFTQHDPVASLGDVDVALNVVDVNGDGKPDVVAAAAFNDTEAPYDLLPGAYGGYLVSVLAGDGSGGFAPASLYRVASQAYDLTVSDLRNSGKPDIVTVGQLWGEASYLANDGTGGFGTPAGETIGYLHGVYNAPVPYTPVQTIDLNGDGKADVLFVEYGQTNSVPPQMTALLNQGNGRLSAPIRSAITVGPTNPYLVIAAGNFRNANVADVIYVDENTLPNVAAFMRGNGDGTFAAPVTLASLPSPCAIVTGILITTASSILRCGATRRRAPPIGKRSMYFSATEMARSSKFRRRRSRH